MESDTLKVLLVDDDQGDFEMTRAMLAQAEHGSFSLDWVSTFEEAIDAFKSGEYDVFLVDYFLEDRTGLDLLAAAGNHGVSQPIIMLTGRGSRRVDEEALAAGAADYLVKGQIDPETLERSIRYALERNQGARALQESEERHRTMFHHLPVGLYRTGPDGAFIDANPALLRILGYADKDALRDHFSATLYVHPEDQERLWNLLKRDGVVRGFESSIRRPDGSVVRVRNTARLHTDARGEVLYVEGTVEDITAEKRAEELWGGEARFRAAFQESESGMALLDLKGVIREANLAFARFFGTRGTDLEGVLFPELLAEDDRPATLRELDSLARGAQNLTSAERRFSSAAGGERWARTSLTLVRNANGEPEEILAVVSDRPLGGG